MSNYNLDVQILKEVCPIYNDSINADNERSSSANYNIDKFDGNIMSLKDNYVTKVEYGNEYIKNLLETEKKYFETKYGKQIYEYLKDKRTKYIDNDIKSWCSTEILPNCQGQVDTGNGSNIKVSLSDVDINSIIPNLKIDISNEFDLFNKLNSTDNNTYKNIEKIYDFTEFGSNKINELDHKTALNQRKIALRQNELLRTNSLNTWLTYAYFIFLLIFFVLLLTQNSLYISTRWPFYLILIFFPVYIYPFLFYYIQKFMRYLSFKNELHGPKTAFLNKKLNFIDNHDI